MRNPDGQGSLERENKNLWTIEESLSNPSIDSRSETCIPISFLLQGIHVFKHSLQFERCRLIIRRKLGSSYVVLPFSLNLVSMYQQVLGNCQYDIEMLQYQKHNLKDLDMKLIWGHWPLYY